ncbi:MAG: SIMPL domain-containing protein [Patescibacteria group bacterium]
MMTFVDNKIKNYLGIVIIAAILILSFAAVSYVNSYASSIQPSAFRSFSVSAEGKVAVVPDVAQFSFGIITEGGKDIAVLQKENTEKSNKINEFIKSSGVKKEDIKTQAYNVEPRYQYSECMPVIRGNGKVCPPPEIVGYTINQSVLVKIRDFAKIGNILTGVAENGANSVSQLSFTLDDPTSVQDQARNEAISKAIEKAKGVAKAGGFRVGRLLSIEENGGYYPVYALKSFGSEAAALLSPTIEPGSEETTVNVILRYEIK